MYHMRNILTGFWSYKNPELERGRRLPPSKKEKKNWMGLIDQHWCSLSPVNVHRALLYPVLELHAMARWIKDVTLQLIKLSKPRSSVFDPLPRSQQGGFSIHTQFTVFPTELSFQKNQSWSNLLSWWATQWEV